MTRPTSDAAHAGTIGADHPGPAALILDGHLDPRELGGKGQSLDRLIDWGLPVPPTGAVTASAYRRFVSQVPIAAMITSLRDGADLPAEEIDGQFAVATFTPGDAESIVAVGRSVGRGSPLAVRSSATVEDLERSSFAGQYRSVLDVDAQDANALLGAVKAVFASLWHPAPRAYRRGFGISDEAAAMAVVLMQMVPALRAGVVFTVDPGGDPARARIEVVEGLAETLVSGSQTPDAVVLPRVGGRGGAAPELSAALDLALRVEELSGAPQDVEWAWDGERVWLVQARPITTTGLDEGDGFDDPTDELEVMDLTTAGIGEMLPGVLPPLLWTINAHLVEEAFRRLLDDLAVLPSDITGPRAIVRRVRGRAAMDFARLEGMAGALPGSAAAELEGQYFGSRRRDRPVAPAPSRSVGRLRSMAHDLRVLRARQRSALDAAITTEATAGILADRPDLAALDDVGLLAHHLRLLDLATRGMAAELGVAADATAIYGRLQQMLRRHLPADDAGRLAAQAVARIGFVTAPDPDSSAAVFAGPTWAELDRTPPAPRSAAPCDEDDGLAEVFAALRATSAWDDGSMLARLRTRAIRRLSHEAAARLAQRERTKTALLALGGEVRRVHLELGQRLTETGQLDDPAEIDLLTDAEVRGLLRGEPSVTPDTILRRKRWRARYAADGPLPPRFSGRPSTTPATELTGRRVEGWAASGGRFRGRVQIVASPSDDLRPDAVLVAEATDPSWSPLFLRAGALVLDRGGPLSHAAILARELGLPAVLNVPGATSLLAGREVTVDGDLGVVIVHDEEEP